MTAAEIWGSVVPAWLGGIGGMAAAIVSTIALIQSLRNKGGVETLKDAANKPTDPDDRLDEPTTESSPEEFEVSFVEEAEETDGDYSPTTEQAEMPKFVPPPRPIQSFGPAAPTPSPPPPPPDESTHTNADRTMRRRTSSSAQTTVNWTVQRESKGKYRLKNDSPNASATATLTSFGDVTPSGGEAAHYDGPLPVTIAPGDSVPFMIEKSLVSPSISAIELTWRDADGISRRRTLYV